jgi:hypothetical protein
MIISTPTMTRRSNQKNMVVWLHGDRRERFDRPGQREF